MLFFASTAAHADLQKFVYAYDSSGALLTPSNAAAQCPDPDGSTQPATMCHGVLVNTDGTYSLKLPKDSYTSDANLILVVVEYEVKGNRYVLMSRNRRVDGIAAQSINNGVDINKVSEAVVKAVEQSNGVPGDDKGAVNSALASLLSTTNADAVNTAMGNGNEDNVPTDDTQKREREIITANCGKLSNGDAEQLVTLASIALNNVTDETILSTVRKNTLQALLDPTLLIESVERVFSHVAIIAANSNSSVLFLDADKYRAELNETVNFTTARSVNPSNFFAYSWAGLFSESSTAEMAQAIDGSYLVCATGEISGGNDSSTDCVRVMVAKPVKAVATASAYRIGVSGTIFYSGEASVNATTYQWSGSGFFSDTATATGAWKAPAVPGTYAITLLVNNEYSDVIEVEVYDVLPVALAQASADSAALSDGSATLTFTSLSTTTDGSALDSLQWSVVGQPPGSAPTLSSIDGETTVLTMNKVGNYTVELMAKKGDHEDTTEVTVRVAKAGAVHANAGKDQTTYRNTAVTLDGSKSASSSGNVLSYLWSAASGTVLNATSANASFSSTILGVFDVTLTVTDGSSSAGDVTQVTVRNRKPVASDDTFKQHPGRVLYGRVRGSDGDNDSLVYIKVTDPKRGGLTLDTQTGEFAYVPAGTKDCKLDFGSTPPPELIGEYDVPVLKLCADRYIAAPGEVVTLTASHSINASKFSGYSWVNATADSSEITRAYYTPTTPGTFTVCVIGDTGSSRQSSIACTDIVVSSDPSKAVFTEPTDYTDRFKFKVNDGTEDSNTATATLIISTENFAPDAQSQSVATVEETPVSGQLTATDVDGDALTFALSIQGTKGSASVSSSGAFTYTPALNKFGTDTFRFTASDATHTSLSGIVTVTISNVNDTPMATYTKTLAVVEDTVKSDTLTGTDPDGDALQYRLITQATLGTVTITNAATGAFSYAPNANAIGNDFFYYSVFDGVLESATAKVDVTISNVSDAPVANDVGPLSVNADAVLKDKLVVSNFDKNSLLYSIVTQPTRGTVVLNASKGTFTYTPTSLTNLGADAFTYKVSDATTTSNTATVSIIVLASNQAPNATGQMITVLEGVPYSGILTGADADAQSITFSMGSNGTLGTAEISSASTGAFIYTPKPGASGQDFFTFKTSDGEKVSTVASVNVSIVPLNTLCAGPTSAKKDADGDGYADYVETEFSTFTNDASSTPYGKDPVALGVSFSNDDDSDGYIDHPELWLKSDPRSASSQPSTSSTKTLPDCFTAARDTAAPVLQALKILTPSVDASSGSATAKFALTALDNASGLTKAVIRLTGPSGIEHKTTVTINSNPLVYYAQVTSPAFNAFAETGTWNIADVVLTDGAGQMLILSTADLKANGYSTTLTVTNSNSDPTKPTMSNFEVLTPALDVTAGALPASFRVTTADNSSGIKRIAVALRSPSGSFRWGEINRSDALTSLTATINTNVLEPYVEQGTWDVTELTITDNAGNTYKLNKAQLQAKGYSTAVVVTTSGADSIPPGLDSFQVLTGMINPVSCNISAKYQVQLTDGNSGISDAVVVLTGPSGQVMLGNEHDNTPEAAATMIVVSEVFACDAQPGIWTVTSLLVTDAAGNVRNWSTADLISLGFETTLIVRGHARGDEGGKPNKAPVATGSSISTNEDVAVSGVLRASDADRDALTYTLMSNGTNGTVVITNAATGEYTYTPTANVNGNDTFSFKVDDGTTTSNVAIVSIEIVPVADPTLAESNTLTVTAGTGVIASFKATDADGLPLTYVVVDAPSKGAVANINMALGTYTYAANTDASGTDTFTYTAGDSNSVSTKTTVTVKIVPEVSLAGFNILTPVVSSSDAKVTVSVAVSLSNPIADISELRFSMRSPTGTPVYGFVKTVSGAWPVIVSSEFTTASSPIVPGTWTFINLTAKKTGQTIGKTVAADIAAAGFADTLLATTNTSPTANGAALTAVLGTVKTGNLSATDPDGDAINYRVSVTPTKGDLVVDAATGAFSYTPRAFGADSFRFIANDGKSDSSAALVSINNTKSNDDPVAYAMTLTVTRNEAYTGTLTASDPNGNALVYSIVSTPSKGVVNITNTATGAFVYYPTTDVTGADSFTFKVNDGNADSNTATVSLTIGVPNDPPTANAQSITVFKGVSYSGALSGTDPEGASLTYSIVTQSVHGTVSLTAATGAFIYTPASGYTGADSFTFRVSDGVNFSNVATVSIDVISAAQACGNGGIEADADSDHDGYADEAERAMGSDRNSAASVPADVNGQAPSYAFKGDTDVDGVKDHIEVWLHTDPRSAASKPKAVMSDCFGTGSDGIKPRLLGFDIITDTVTVSSGETTASYALTVSDNASGVKRVRVSLRSPAGIFVTQSMSYSDAPVLRALRIDVDAFGTFSEAGKWTITGIAIFDEAGNRLDIATADLQTAGLPYELTVVNTLSDATAPSLTGFTILTPTVDASTGTAKFGVHVDASDAGSGLASLRVDFMSSSGTIVSAVTTLVGSPASGTTLVETLTLSAYLEQGTWTVFGVLLVDTAGNSAQVASTLVSSGFANTLSVTNANSDTTPPQLVSITALTPDVTPSTGSARMSFGISATDNLSGVEKVRLDIVGPSGQVIVLWGNYGSTHPTALTAQIDSAILNVLLETGTWTIDAVDVYDNAGNHAILYADELASRGLTTIVTVQ